MPGESCRSIFPVLACGRGTRANFAFKTRISVKGSAPSMLSPIFSSSDCDIDGSLAYGKVVGLSDVPCVVDSFNQIQPWRQPHACCAIEGGAARLNRREIDSVADTKILRTGIELDIDGYS